MHDSRMLDPAIIDEFTQSPPFELSETDRAVLRAPQEDFPLHTWEEMKAIIGEHYSFEYIEQTDHSAGRDMSLLRRTPLDLFNYIRWTLEAQRQDGSVLEFIIKNRLPWEPECHESGTVFPYSNPTPFTDPSDFCIRRNDWPYAMEEGMVHLVAWSKTPIATDDHGDPSPASCKAIADFIERMFSEHVKRGKYAGDNLQWFRNRTKWQSVRSLDHIHLVLRDVNETFVTRITGQGSGDITCKAYPWNIFADI
ncbi:uncharacterized protein N7483_001552 [Penicillium malachiteum]|uniref:uncharacterized protein n=1 Tax=Penicillium malachiteum TaxID=1324776 RepID=UPI0025475307|nr:uncharacterized protein N7483_001552 [Penicillium malachiteum]KAJ5736427.1 hypothetical protein N7483_001552 [Penicillium malachiteum]